MYIEFKRGLESSSLDFFNFFFKLEISGSIYRDGAILCFFDTWIFFTLKLRSILWKNRGFVKPE